MSHNTKLNRTVTRVQIPDETVRNSYCVNSIGKGINPTIIPPVNSRADYALLPGYNNQFIYQPFSSGSM